MHSKAAFSLKPDPHLLPASMGTNCQLDLNEMWIFSDGLQSIKSIACSDGIRRNWSLKSPWHGFKKEDSGAN